MAPGCVGSARNGERALSASEYSGLRARIFKASGSTDPMWFFLKSAEARPLRSIHRLDEPAERSLGMVASQQSQLPFRPARSL